jgi:hypothetical protein
MTRLSDLTWWEADFPGKSLDRDACEALLFDRWPERERRREPELMGTKWWDVRLLHPVQATYWFAHLLTFEVRRIIREHLDDRAPSLSASGRVLDWHPIKSGDVFEPPLDERRRPYWKRKIIGLIRARQAADLDGVPYEVFVASGLKHFYFGRGAYVLARSAVKMPEPNLLYGENCLAQIREDWLAQLQVRPWAARHGRYRLAHDDGHPDHRAHRDWLVQQLSLRSQPELAAARLVRDGLLSRPEAEKVCLARGRSVLTRFSRALEGA